MLQSGAPDNRKLVEVVYSQVLTPLGLERPEGFSINEFLSLVFKRHTDAEMDAYFTAGTPDTTPPLSKVCTEWPKPWAFSRALVFAIVLYGALNFAFLKYQNNNLIPGLILTGSFAVPVSALILFWELNAPRNVSLYQVVKLFLLGGVLSLFSALLVGEFLPLPAWLGDSSAGPIEETGKLLAVVLVARSGKYPYTLNGMLLGAAVGAGFAAFESAGYALNSYTQPMLLAIGMLLNGTVPNDLDNLFSIATELMKKNLVVRGMLAPAGHVVWTALTAAAFWRVKGNATFNLGMLSDFRFLGIFGFAVIAHMIWNTSWELPLYAKQVVLGVAAWSVAVGMVHYGLTEVRSHQINSAAPTIPDDSQPGE